MTRSSPEPKPPLRLVGQNDPEAALAWSVARENQAAAASDLEPTDPRWALAVRVHSELQGTVLTPERRQRVLTTAAALGIRTFEANMIIALVQDRARRGEPLGTAAGQLAVVPTPEERPRRHDALRLFVAALTAAVIVAFVIRWFLS